jgi:hypothetical protein
MIRLTLARSRPRTPPLAADFFQNAHYTTKPCKRPIKMSPVCQLEMTLLNKHLVLVVQDRLLDYMAKEFSFAHLTHARTSDPMHFHAYTLKPTPDGHRLELLRRLSTDTEGIATCLGLQAEAKIELDVILRATPGFFGGCLG